MTVSILRAPRVRRSTEVDFSRRKHRRGNITPLTCTGGKPPSDRRRNALGPSEVGIVASHSAAAAGKKPVGPPEERIAYSATPAGRKTRLEREWYTPAKNWDETRPASVIGGAISGDGELSDEVTRVEDATGRHSRTSRSRKEDSVTTFRVVEDPRREAAPVRSVRQRPNRLPPPVAPQPPSMCEPPRNERVVERRPRQGKVPRGS